MCGGISLSWRDVPDAIIERHQLQDRVVIRHEGSDREIRFLYRDPRPMLPVWRGHQLEIITWGNRDDKQSKLPRTGWARTESLEAGRWRHLKPEPVDIPAVFGLEKGVWFQIREGIRGVLVPDERGMPHVYMLTEPATHYYHVMTRHDRMPVLIGERI